MLSKTSEADDTLYRYLLDERPYTHQRTRQLESYNVGHRRRHHGRGDGAIRVCDTVVVDAVKEEGLDLTLLLGIEVEIYT
jgi:hypothetical protein